MNNPTRSIRRAAVAAAPAGYTPPTVYSVSVNTTVSGTVDPDGN